MSWTICIGGLQLTSDYLLNNHICLLLQETMVKGGRWIMVSMTYPISIDNQTKKVFVPFWGVVYLG